MRAITKASLSSPDFHTNLLQYLKTAKDDIENIYLIETDIDLNSVMQIDTFGESINAPNNKFINNLKIINVNWLADIKFSIKVEFDIKTSLDYYTDYSEYMYLEEQTSRVVFMNSMDEGTCELSEEFKMIFSGYIEIEIPNNLTSDDIRTHSKYLSSSDNPIQLEIQIESAKLTEDIWT